MSTTYFPRIRQIVIVSRTLATAKDLKYLLNLGAPFHDKGVAEFGLENAVFAIGDQFLEIIAPLPDQILQQVPAGRFLTRNGAGGYMIIFQIADIHEARNRVDTLNIRRVWNIDLTEIAASHLHPADTGGAIISIDEARPQQSWKWAGSDWENRSQIGKIVGATLGSLAPTQLAAKWGNLLNVPPKADKLGLNDGQMNFLKAKKEGLLGFQIEVADIEAILERAQKLKLPIKGHTVRFQGVDLNLSEYSM